MVATRSGGKRSEPDTGKEEPAAKRQTKLEDHNIEAEDDDEIQEMSKEQVEDEKEATKQDQETKEVQSQAIEGKPESVEAPDDAPASEDVKAAVKDLEKQDEVLEYGHIYFFYKPKVATDHPSSIDDVARLHIILKPSEGQSRLIIVGRKFLPDPNSNSRPIWSFVKQLADDPADLSSHLAASSYETKTRGTRTVGEDRLIGTGPYAIVYHEGEKVSDRSSHVAYVLEAPLELGEVQEAFHLAHEGSFGLSVRNPKTPAPPQAGLSTPAEFPDDLLEAFEGRRWNPVLDIRYLNAENSELLLVTHKKDIKGGAEITEDLETMAEEDASHLKEHELKTVAQHVYRDLHIKKGSQTLDLETITGSWD